MQHVMHIGCVAEANLHFFCILIKKHHLIRWNSGLGPVECLMFGGQPSLIQLYFLFG